jgi:rhodanese-related sulfurtransferase
MFKKIILAMIVFVSIANASFREVDYQELQKMVKEKKVVLIDIRRVDEFKQYGIIKDAKTITFFDEQGQYNIPSWMKEFVKVVKTKEQPFILYCAHANRSKVVGNFLDKQLGYKNVYDLKGGINYGWIDKGLKTVEFK